MSILIIHHVATNNLGILEAVLIRRKLPFQYRFCHELTPADIALEAHRGLIILGGQESAADDQIHPFMPLEHQMIRSAMAQGVPLFGICLGAQMMARSLGAVVEKNKVAGFETKEIGWTPLTLTPEGLNDPVLSQLEGMAQFQWHEDTYHLPPGAVQLAATDLCPQQAFCLPYCASPTYGVQFHPEVTLAVIRAWLAASKTMSPERSQAIWQETEQHFATSSAASVRLFEAFCDRAF